MIGTVQAVTERLDSGGGLVYRSDPEVSDDGLPTPEGALVPCSFWLVCNLAGQGRLDEAGQLDESPCYRDSPLVSEGIEPSTGAFLGNFPLAFIHIGVISGGIGVSRRLSEADGVGGASGERPMTAHTTWRECI